MKKALKYIGKFLAVFIAFILLYAIVAFGLSRITVDKESNTKEEVAIYIITNGIHTDIVLPVKHLLIDWTKDVRYDHIMSADTTAYKYLAMGWGDKGFYLDTPEWSDLKASVAFKAATGLSTTAIHTTYYTSMLESDTCKKIMISNNQYKRLVSYIQNSFQKDENGRFMHIETNANYGPHDAFYEATGTYSLFKTCNTWANSGLKASGQKACLWTAFDTGIFLKYQ